MDLVQRKAYQREHRDTSRGSCIQVSIRFLSFFSIDLDDHLTSSSPATILVDQTTNSGDDIREAIQKQMALSRCVSRCSIKFSRRVPANLVIRELLLRKRNERETGTKERNGRRREKREKNSKEFESPSEGRNLLNCGSIHDDGTRDRKQALPLTSPPLTYDRKFYLVRRRH